MSDESVQDILERAMPPIQHDDPGEGIRMTSDEQAALHDYFDGIVTTLKDRGFNANELHVILHAINHRLNAERFDRHEYDRIALTLRLRETIEEWRDEQEHDVPEHEVATVVEEMGRFYRTTAREKLARKQGRQDCTEVADIGGEPDE